MACAWCRHFYRSLDSVEGKHGKEWLFAPGECTRDPVHIPVNGAHVCGSFEFMTNKHNYDGTSLIVAWWLRLNDDSSRKLKSEIKRLKEANAKLRAKLKATS